MADPQKQAELAEEQADIAAEQAEMAEIDAQNASSNKGVLENIFGL
jgi:hypothetical protein